MSFGDRGREGVEVNRYASKNPIKQVSQKNP